MYATVDKTKKNRGSPEMTHDAPSGSDDDGPQEMYATVDRNRNKPIKPPALPSGPKTRPEVPKKPEVLDSERGSDFRDEDDDWETSPDVGSYEYENLPASERPGTYQNLP